MIGLSTLGYRVMMTIGERITELTPTRGYAAEFAAAITIVIASRMALPVSTTHTLVGAVLGVGLARGIGALDFRVVGTNGRLRREGRQPPAPADRYLITW